jgi:hypothetical protein
MKNKGNFHPLLLGTEVGSTACKTVCHDMVKVKMNILQLSKFTPRNLRETHAPLHLDTCKRKTVRAVLTIARCPSIVE